MLSYMAILMILASSVSIPPSIKSSMLWSAMTCIRSINLVLLGKSAKKQKKIIFKPSVFMMLSIGMLITMLMS